MIPFLKVAVKNLFSKPSTVEYPNKVTESPAKEGYRGRIAYDAEKCIGCGKCMKVCCPGAITRSEETAPGGKNITLTFDLTSCTFCGTCADFCDDGAIKMTEDYHMVGTCPEDFLVSGTRFKAMGGTLTCSDACVFCTLCAKKCPNGAITVDRAEKKWEVTPDKCVQCGICVDNCPKKALSFQ